VKGTKFASPEIFHIFPIMAASTGLKPAEDLPKTLRNMLTLLLEENGLRSWQVYSDKQGVSVRLRFQNTSNGGQEPPVNNQSFSRKSPSRILRDGRKTEERRITRQMAKKEKDSEIEEPRGEIGIGISGHSALFSPASVDVSTAEVDPDSIKCESSPIPVNNGQACLSQSSASDQQLDLSRIDMQPGDTNDTNSDGSDNSSQDSDNSSQDSDNNSEKSGANVLDLSFPIAEYDNPRPTTHQCSYCGTTMAYFVWVCKHENCGRKVCRPCSKELKHDRHYGFLQRR
jgi:hypothetical protein